MKNYKRRLRIVTAYMVENGVNIGPLAVDSKTNEIPCVREPLDLIDIENKIITADAEHCQKDTVAKIIQQHRDYCICLKANQKQMYDDIKLYFEGIRNGEFECRTVSTSEKSRERYEVRKCYVFNDISWLNDVHERDGLKSVFAIQRKTTTGNDTADEVNFYISSMEAGSERYLDIVRKHWRIESMHW